MEILTSLIPALLGSAGITSLIVELRGRGRSSRDLVRLEELRKIRDSLDTSSHAYAAADQAVTSESTRIALLSMRRRSAISKPLRFLLALVIVIVLLIFIAPSVLEFLQSEQKIGDVIVLTMILALVVLYGFFIVLVLAALDQDEADREFNKELVKLPYVVETSAIRRAKKQQERRERGEARWEAWSGRRQDRKWAKARRKVQETRRRNNEGRTDTSA